MQIGGEFVSYVGENLKASISLLKNIFGKEKRKLNQSVRRNSRTTPRRFILKKNPGGLLWKAQRKFSGKTNDNVHKSWFANESVFRNKGKAFNCLKSGADFVSVGAGLCDTKFIHFTSPPNHHEMCGQIWKLRKLNEGRMGRMQRWNQKRSAQEAEEKRFDGRKVGFLIEHNWDKENFLKIKKSVH